MLAAAIEKLRREARGDESSGPPTGGPVRVGSWKGTISWTLRRNTSVRWLKFAAPEMQIFDLEAKPRHRWLGCRGSGHQVTSGSVQLAGQRGYACPPSPSPSPSC